MAVITYFIRVFPMVIFRKRIKSAFLQAFLHYIPYCILTAMIIPTIFYSTTYKASAIIGTAVALILAWFEKSLLFVSMAAVVAAYFVEIFIRYAY
jgi:branched-subunit amino acid transport protein